MSGRLWGAIVAAVLISLSTAAPARTERGVSFFDGWRELEHEDEDFCDQKAPEPNCLLEFMLACRTYGDDRFCRFARDRSYPLKFVKKDYSWLVDPPVAGDKRVPFYRVLDWWWLDQVPFRAPEPRREHGVQALVQLYDCMDLFHCTWDKRLYTFAEGEAGWVVEDAATPWCERQDRGALPAALSWLRPAARLAGRLLCDRVLAKPDPMVPPPDPPGQGRIITMTGGNSPCIGRRPFWRPGDIQIEVAFDFCTRGRCSDYTNPPTLFTLRWDSRVWRVADAYRPDSD